MKWNSIMWQKMKPFSCWARLFLLFAGSETNISPPKGKKKNKYFWGQKIQLTFKKKSITQKRKKAKKSGPMDVLNTHRMQHQLQVNWAQTLCFPARKHHLWQQLICWQQDFWGFEATQTNAANREWLVTWKWGSEAGMLIKRSLVSFFSAFFKQNKSLNFFFFTW